jgi:hypothetical protein
LSTTGLAEVTDQGILSSLKVGTIEVNVHDSLFIGLASQPFGIRIVESLFSLRPKENVTLQRGGTVTIETVGGSGIYQWELSSDILTNMEGHGAKRYHSDHL